MNEISFFTLMSSFLVGIILGGGFVFLFLKQRTTNLQNKIVADEKIFAKSQAELLQTSLELKEVSKNFHQAAAERNLLRSQNIELANRATTDHNVIKTLAPVSDKINQLQVQVGSLEKERAQQFGALQEQLQQSRLVDEQLRVTTESLASALRNNSTRGRWGEVQLKRIVEAAGMLASVDFFEQVTSTNDAEKTIRPDLIIKLPGNKFIALDAKVPLNAYLEAQDIPDTAIGQEQERRVRLLNNHVKALKGHVDDLANKKYWEAAGNSPEIVICFIPVESFLGAALEADSTLLDYSFSKGVVLASPVSLLAIMKSIAYSWSQNTLTDNAKELFELAKQLYGRLSTLGENVTKLGSSIKTSVDRYNSLVGSLETRVLPAARKLNNLDEKTVLPENEIIQILQPLESVPKSLTAVEFLGEQ